MKLEKRIMALLLCSVTLAIFTTGCGGIRASKSISPLDFLLPGLLRNDPASGPLSPDSAPEAIIAQAS
ncbi:MAG TPA: hypothetical protein VMZ27_05430 [Candidatus Saccharimonadales bacterium]|nr:hypothetical protein [Candidatus Saccharimonadales bacterium]